ncbi:hypothetical protein WG906_07725 [Pedobacter sp. P351]|uniref:hypothetical protein n=1 Tax=Pedobacter superstes TaxID=3133441 RepID=UPI00309BE014
MNAFTVNVNGLEYSVIPQLHEGFYSVSNANTSGMIGKGSDGKWEASLQSSNSVALPAAEIGEAIEKYLAAQTI